MILESERRAIVDILVRYCTAIDTGAWHLMADVFLPNARVDYRGAGGPVLGGAETAEWLAENMAKFEVLQHFVSNVQVTQDGDAVRSTAYVHAVHGFKGDDEKLRFFDLGGEYSDRLIETAQGWRISERVLTTKWLRGDLPGD